MIFTYKNKDYRVDSEGFLINPRECDVNFVEGMASKIQLPDRLSAEHWRVIDFIRRYYRENGKCPLVYQTCQMNGLHYRELKRLFPTGYLRGACKLAGVSYKEENIEYHPEEEQEGLDIDKPYEEKIYRVDVRGFLIDPSEWDRQFALFKAYEMKMPEKLTAKHWQVITFLRDSFKKNKMVPTVYETCETNRLELEELERLFPDGYHRGAVKIAGLRVR